VINKEETHVDSYLNIAGTYIHTKLCLVDNKEREKLPNTRTHIPTHAYIPYVPRFTPPHVTNSKQGKNCMMHACDAEDTCMHTFVFLVAASQITTSFVASADAIMVPQGEYATCTHVVIKWLPRGWSRSRVFCCSMNTRPEHIHYGIKGCHVYVRRRGSFAAQTNIRPTYILYAG